MWWMGNISIERFKADMFQMLTSAIDFSGSEAISVHQLTTFFRRRSLHGQARELGRAVGEVSKRIIEMSGLLKADCHLVDNFI